MKSVGILGLGTYLPPHVRTNDWWPAEVVAGWGERMAHRATRPDAGVEALTPGQRATMAAMGAGASDPFRGARERRVMGDDMTAPGMEAIAARQALQRAKVLPSEIDVILTQTPVPEHLMVNGACVTHKLLELPRRCIALATDGACNGFALHASLAQALIASGQARHVLSVHSSAITRVHGPVEPHSAWWGDGAAAAVFGQVADGKGLRAAVHNSDGASCEALVLGVPGKRWYDDGAITTHSVDREHTRTMLMTLVDRAQTAIGDAIQLAGIGPSRRRLLRVSSGHGVVYRADRRARLSRACQDDGHVSASRKHEQCQRAVYPRRRRARRLDSRWLGRGDVQRRSRRDVVEPRAALGAIVSR